MPLNPPSDDAPGALHADLSASISLGRPEREISNPLLSLVPSNGPELPAITMVFCIVEGSKLFVKRYRKEAEHVSVCGGGVAPPGRCIPAAH
jgi:hypothetical protein